MINLEVRGFLGGMGDFSFSLSERELVLGREVWRKCTISLGIREGGEFLCMVKGNFLLSLDAAGGDSRSVCVCMCV